MGKSKVQTLDNLADFLRAMTEDSDEQEEIKYSIQYLKLKAGIQQTAELLLRLEDKRERLKHRVQLSLLMAQLGKDVIDAMSSKHAKDGESEAISDAYLHLVDMFEYAYPEIDDMLEAHKKRRH